MLAARSSLRRSAAVLRRNFGSGGGGGHATPLGKSKGVQEMPPPGGFPMVNYARGMPAQRGPSGTQLWVLGTAAVVYGFYQIIQGNNKRRKYAIEKRNARIAVLPFLQAESDAKYVVARKEHVEREAEIMKDIPFWEAGASVYNSGRFMPPSLRAGFS